MMRLYVVVTFAVAVVLLIAQGTTLAALPRIAVLRFECTDRQFSAVLSQALSTEIVNSKRFRVMEYQQVEKLLEKQAFDLSGAVSPDTAVKIGKLSGCQLVATGTVMDIDGPQRETGKGLLGEYDDMRATVTVNFKVIDAETGEIWIQSNEQGYASKPYDSSSRDSVLRQAACDAVEKFVPKIFTSARGKIVKIGTDCVVTNLGSEKGITEGAEFVIKQVGEEIHDPDTGELLSRGSRVVCRAHVVPGSVEAKICKIAPGAWKGVRILIGKRYEWRPDPSKLSELKVGNEVMSVAPEH